MSLGDGMKVLFNAEPQSREDFLRFLEFIAIDLR